MKLDLNENDMMLATILLLAGAIAAIALKQIEVINSSAQYQVLPPLQQSYSVPVISAQPKSIQTIEPLQLDEPTVIADVTPVQVPQTSPIVYRSPITMMGYNANDDLVSIARRLQSGEVVRRKIRDPEMDTSDLEVSRWVEFNEYQKETDMTWM